MASMVSVVFLFLLSCLVAFTVNGQNVYPRDTLVEDLMDSVMAAGKDMTDYLWQYKNRPGVKVEKPSYFLVRLTVEENKIFTLGEFFADFSFEQCPKCREIPLTLVEFDESEHFLTMKSGEYGTQAAIADDSKLCHTSLEVQVTVDSKYDFEIKFSGLLCDSEYYTKASMVFVSKEGYFTLTASKQLPSTTGKVSDIVKEYTGLDMPMKMDFVPEYMSLSRAQKIHEDSISCFSLKYFRGKTDKLAIVVNNDELGEWKGFAVRSTDDTISLKEVYMAVPLFGDLATESIAYIELATSSKVCNIPTGMFKDVLIFVPECIHSGVSMSVIFEFSITAFVLENTDTDIMLYPAMNAITLREMLHMLAPGLNMDEMNDDRDFFFDTRIVYNIGVKQISIPLEAHDPYFACVDLIDNKKMSFFYNQLVIAGADIKFCLRQESSAVSVDVFANGEIVIEKSSFKASVAKENQEYTITASAENLEMSDAIEYFHAQVFPRSQSTALKNSPFLRFSLKSPHLEHHISSIDKQFLKISGNPVLQDYGSASLDSLVVHNRTNQLAMEFSIVDVPLVTLLRDVTQLDIADGIPMLDERVDATVVISPSDLNDPYILHKPVIQGVSVESDFSIAGSCPYCKIAQSLLSPNKQFKVQGTMTSADSLSLIAKNLRNSIKLGNGFTMQDAGFSILVTKSSTNVGVTGSLPISFELDDSHSFSTTLLAAIEPAKEGLKVRLSMDDCWTYGGSINTLGKWLAICNLNGTVDVDAVTSSVLPPLLELGSAIKFGNNGCISPLVTKGQVDLSADSISYSAQFSSRLPFTSFIKALTCTTAAPTRPLKESFFPIGLTASYSSKTKKNLEAGVHYFKGLMEILGLLGSAEVILNIDSDNLALTTRLPLVSIGDGLIVLYDSLDDQSTGPLLQAKLGKSSSDVSIEGSMTVLGNNVADVRLTVSEKKFTFNNMVLKLGNLYKTSVTISALYSTYLPSATFQIQGTIASDLQNAIYKVMTDVFMVVVTEANRKLKDAQMSLKSKNNLLKSAQTVMMHDKSRVADAHGDLGALVDASLDAEKKYQAAFTKCPKWIGDGCKPMALMAKKHLETSQRSKKNAAHSLELAKASLAKTEKSLSSSANASNTATEFLDHIKEKYKLALRLSDVMDENKARNADGSLNIKKLIDVGPFTIKAKLSDVDSGTFVVRGSIDFFRDSPSKKTKLLQMVVNLNDLTPTCKELADHMGDDKFGTFFQ